MKKRWFRVVVDGTGKAVDCRAVGDEGVDQLGIFYILAIDAKEAGRIAGNAHAARLLAARRARYAAEGLCKCGRARDRSTFRECSRCAARGKVHYGRDRAKARGEAVPPLDRRTVLQERKLSERDAIRQEVLEEVRAQWRNHPTVGGFTRWLEQELQALTRRKVA